MGQSCCKTEAIITDHLIENDLATLIDCKEVDKTIPLNEEDKKLEKAELSHILDNPIIKINQDEIIQDEAIKNEVVQENNDHYMDNKSHIMDNDANNVSHLQIDLKDLSEISKTGEHFSIELDAKQLTNSVFLSEEKNLNVIELLQTPQKNKETAENSFENYFISEAKKKIDLAKNALKTGFPEVSKKMMSECYFAIEADCGLNSKTTYQALLVYAKSELLTENYQGAQALLVKLLEAKEKNDPDYELTCGEALNLLIDSYIGENRYPEAKMSIDKLMNTLSKHYKPSDLVVLEAMEKLSYIQIKCERYDAAKKQLCALLNYISGREPIAYKIYLNYACVLLHFGQQNDAEKYYKLSLESANQIFGKNSKENYQVHQILAEFYFTRSNYSEAQSFFQGALEIGTELKYNVKKELYYLAKINEFEENYKAALKLLQEVQELFDPVKDGDIIVIVSYKITLLNQILTDEKLTEIVFSFKNLNENDTHEIIKLFKRSLKTHFETVDKVNLKVLHQSIGLSYRAIVLLATALVQAKNMTELHLDLQNSEIKDNTFQSLAISLENIPNLTKLSLGLQMCHISDVGIGEFSNALASLPKLKELSLNLMKNDITNKGALSIVKSLATTQMLSQLCIDFSYTSVTMDMKKNFQSLNGKRKKGNKITINIIILQKLKNSKQKI